MISRSAFGPSPAARRAPRQARSRRKRDALLTAALALFGAHGYETVGSEAIALAAGVSVGTFYAYFANKRAVLLTLVEAHADQVLHVGLGELAGAVDPAAAISAAVRRVLAAEATAAGLRRAYLEAQAADKEVAAFAAAQQAKVEERLAAAIRQAQAHPAARPSVDAAAAARTICTLLQHLGADPAADPVALVPTAAAMIFHLLYTDAAEPPR